MKCRKKSVPAFVTLLLLSLSPIFFVHQSFAASCVPPPSEMVSWWGGDNNALDMVGTNNGTLVNGATFVPGMVGQAFSFDGVNDYVEMPHSDSLNLTGGLTLETWFKLRSAGNALLFFKGDGNGSDTVTSYLLSTNSDGSFNVVLYGNYPADNWGTAAGLVTTDQWYHVAITWDGTYGPADNVKLYLNGALVQTWTKSLAPLNVTTQTLALGAMKPPYNRIMNGLIDEPAIFSRALSADEIQAIYDAGSAGKCRSCTPPPSGMVSWWGGDNNPLDMAGGHDGSLMGNAAYTSGMVGQAFNLDGAFETYVEVPNTAVFNPAGAFSVDGWFYIDPDANKWKISTFVAKSEGSSGNGWALYYDDRSWTHDLKFIVGSNAVMTNAVPTPGWYHIAGVFDPAVTPRTKLYLNGVQVADSGSQTGGPTGNSYNVRIGAMNWADEYGGTDRLNGKADEVEFFNRALSADEIAAIYNAGSTGKCRSCTPPPSGMISWWKAEDNAWDIVGGHDGALHGNTTYVRGKVGQAFIFDGTGDFVDAGNDAVFNFSAGAGDLSIDAWIYLASYNAEYSGIVSKASYAPGFYGWGLSVTESGQLYYEQGNGSLGSAFASGAIPLNTWTHVAFTRESNLNSLYIDGRLDFQVGSIDVSMVSNNNLRIGALSSGGGYFNGLIDEVEIFNRALSADEIAQIYNAGCAGKCAYAITTNTPSNGSIVCNDLAAGGYDAFCTITPAEGYYISALLDNGVPVDVGGSVLNGIYTIPNVTEAHTVEATFARYPVWRDGTTGYFMTLGEAYSGGTTAYVIKAHGIELADSNLNLSGTAAVAIDGGYLPDFSAYSGVPTTITGPLTIGGTGAVTVSNIAVQ